jgi:hypothetical protein
MRRVSPTRARADAYAPFVPNRREFASVIRAASAGRALKCASTSCDGSVWSGSTQCSTPPCSPPCADNFRRVHKPRVNPILIPPTRARRDAHGYSIVLLRHCATTNLKSGLANNGRTMATYWNPRYEALTPNN